MKKQQSAAFWRTFFRLGMFLALLGAIPVGAIAAGELPAVNAVVGGAADIAKNAEQTIMTITQSTAKAAINWNTFNVGAGNTVNFLQPDANSITLNNVLSSSLSTIAGNIHANGQVILCNPNGLVFAAGSQINVGGIIASGRSAMDPAAFMSSTGSYILSGPVTGAGNVNVSGAINAGNYVMLAGNMITATSEASINVNADTVNSDSRIIWVNGTDVTANIDNSTLTNCQVGDDQNQSGTAFHNAAALTAHNGQVIMDGGTANTLNNIISNTNVITANTIDQNNGIIRIINVNNVTNSSAGTLSAPGIEVTIDGNYSQTAALENFEQAYINAGGYIQIDGKITAKSAATYSCLNLYAVSANLQGNAIQLGDVEITNTEKNAVLHLDSGTEKIATRSLRLDRFEVYNVGNIQTVGNININDSLLVGNTSVNATGYIQVDGQITVPVPTVPLTRLNLTDYSISLSAGAVNSSGNSVEVGAVNLDAAGQNDGILSISNSVGNISIGTIGGVKNLQADSVGKFSLGDWRMFGTWPQMPSGTSCYANIVTGSGGSVTAGKILGQNAAGDGASFSLTANTTG